MSSYHVADRMCYLVGSKVKLLKEQNLTQDFAKGSPSSDSLLNLLSPRSVYHDLSCS